MEDSPHAAVYAFSSQLRALARVVEASAALPAVKGKEEVLLRTAAALETASRLVQLGADRNWTGLGDVLIDELLLTTAELSVVERPVRFVRTLLKVYEAPDVKQAKEVFAAALDDEASRERRFDRFTVDFGALLGGRWGEETRHNSPSLTLTRPKNEISTVYGLYAPAGFQIAYSTFGLVLYPVDLGSYLVKTETTESTVPRWTEALRFGAALYLRLWKTVPVVLGGGMDFQPKVVDHETMRVQITIGMDLPLYQLF
jgi:hypothetical protein